MKREDLFEAIGTIEESRLARTEKRQIVSTKRSIFRVMVAAAIIMSLATTAFAYVGFVVYENPGAMLQAFFGEQPEPHGPDCNCVECRATEPTYEREPLNTEVAGELVAPFISKVGDSFVYEDMLKFTVDAHTFDSVTNCGLLYYTMERPEGTNWAQYPIDYQLENSGEIWDVGDPLSVASRLYLIQEESTPYKLKIAAYYIRGALDMEEPNLVFSFGDAEIYDKQTGELIGYDPALSLQLPFDDGGGMKSLTLEDGKILLSPIGMVIHGGLEGVEVNDAGEIRINRVVIQYADGSEYLVLDRAEGSYTENFGYALMDMKQQNITYSLNRVVDIDNVTAVVINGIKFPVE